VEETFYLAEEQKEERNYPLRSHCLWPFVFYDWFNYGRLGEKAE
jgi:hypothetical protein